MEATVLLGAGEVGAAEVGGGAVRVASKLGFVGFCREVGDEFGDVGGFALVAERVESEERWRGLVKKW